MFTLDGWEKFLSTETRDLAEAYSKQHKQAFERWTHGAIDRVWYDTDNVMCIAYADGQWWHYRRTGSVIEWW